MFESLKRAHRFARTGALWARVTGLDLRDGGQIARFAADLMVKRMREPEEAWLESLVAWTTGMPWAEDQRQISECIVRFSSDPRAVDRIPAPALYAARTAALGLLNDLMANDLDAEW
jgi:hypothetical protein